MTVLASIFRKGLMAAKDVRDLVGLRDTLADIVTFNPQVFSAAQKGQARSNVKAERLSLFRNVALNGDFDIWQRGLSFVNSGGGAGSYTADRWRRTGNYSGSTVSWDRMAHSGSPLIPGQPKYYCRMQRTVTGASDVSLSQRIESVRTLAGKRCTLTAYLRGTAGKTVSLGVNQNFGTGGSPSASVSAAAPTVVLTANWSKVQVVFDLPSLSGKTIGTDGNDFIDFGFGMPTAEGNYTLDIAHVSLVEGDASAEADPFGGRPIPLELLLCQRYCQIIDFHIMGGGYHWSNNAATHMELCSGMLPTTMRAVPSVTLQGTPTLDNISAVGLYVDTAAYSLRAAVIAAGVYRAYNGSYLLQAEI